MSGDDKIVYENDNMRELLQVLNLFTNLVVVVDLMEAVGVGFQKAAEVGLLKREHLVEHSRRLLEERLVQRPAADCTTAGSIGHSYFCQQASWRIVKQTHAS